MATYPDGVNSEYSILVAYGSTTPRHGGEEGLQFLSGRIHIINNAGSLCKWEGKEPF